MTMAIVLLSLAAILSSNTPRLLFVSAQSYDVRPSPPLERKFPCAAALGQTIFLAGGSDSNAIPSDRVQIFNAVNSTWTEGLPLNRVREGAGCFFIPPLNRIFMASGWAGAEESFLSSSEYYNVATGEWVLQEIAMSFPRAFAGSAVNASSGDAFLIGGYNGQFLPVVERFSWAANSWITMPPLTVVREGPVAGFTAGRLIVAGGFDVVNLVPLNTVEIWNGLAWSAGPNMLVPRCFHCGGASLGQSTFAVGGWVTVPLNVTEYYVPPNPQAPQFPNGVWVPLGPTPVTPAFMIYPRWGCSATFIGRDLYILGGSSTPTNALSFFEMYRNAIPALPGA